MKTLIQNRKRVLLAALIAVGGTSIDHAAALADNFFSRNSLHVSPSQPDNLVQQNPFCLPSGPAIDQRAIQLASNDSASTIRLKPVGGAIGLQSTQQHDSEKDKKNGKTPSGIIVEEPATAVPEIQVNPLIAPQPAGQMVASAIDEIIIGTQTKAAKAERQSSIILLPRRHAFQAQPNEAESNTVTGVIELTPESTAQPSSVGLNAPGNALAASVATAPMPQSSTAVGPASDTTEPSPPIPQPVDEEPIFFSLSDWGEEFPEPTDVHAPTASAPAPSAEPTLVPVAKAAPATKAAAVAKAVEQQPTPEPVLPPAPSVADHIWEEAAQSDKAAEPVVLELQKKVAKPKIEIADVVPIKLDRVTRHLPHNASEPIVKPAPHLGATAQTTLSAQRYRPPVAVHSVPVSIQNESIQASVTLSPEIDFGALSNGDLGSESARPALKVKLTPLYLDLAQVRSLTLGAELAGVKVMDQEVCQAVAAGPNRLKLIGTGNGVTQLVVWAKPVDEDSKPRLRAFEVHVNKAEKSSGKSAQQKLVVLNESIAKAFPSSDVVVTQGEGKLILSGRCDNEADAKKILRMARKTVLLPVHDELQVR